MNDPLTVQTHYASGDGLRARQEVHRLYTLGPTLEQAVDAALPLVGTESLLDVGTGPGDFPARLLNQGHTGRLVGMDVVAGMVERAKAAHPGLEFVLADAMALPFADSSFDIVSARHMIYHVPDPNKALGEFFRVLKPKGCVMVITNADGFMAEFWEAVLEAVEGLPGFEPLVERERGGLCYYHNELLEQVRQVFGNATLHLHESALELPNAEAALKYHDSYQSFFQIPQSVWDSGRASIQAVFAARTHERPWRISKRVAIVTAEKP
jgi:ubiquinone/menaquinone biosynthesis C-methylase UbiE